MRYIRGSFSILFLAGMIGLPAALAAQGPPTPSNSLTGVARLQFPPGMQHLGGAAFNFVMASKPQPRDCDALIQTALEPINTVDSSDDYGDFTYSARDADIVGLGHRVIVDGAYTRKTVDRLQGRAHDDLQMRLERVRCEQKNIEDKLDFLTTLEAYQIQNQQQPRAGQ